MGIDPVNVPKILITALRSSHMVQHPLPGALSGLGAVIQPDVNLEHKDQIPVSPSNGRPFGFRMVDYDGMRQHQSQPLVGGNA